MADLIAIGYLDEATAAKAAVEVRRPAGEPIVEPDAIATIVRDKEGKFQVTTCHQAADDGAEWGMFWDFLFGLLYFVPVFGMAVSADLGAIIGRLAKSGIPEEFVEQARDMLQPGTSALFLVVVHHASDRVIGAVSPLGGTILKSSLTDQAQTEIQEALHGAPAA